MSPEKKPSPTQTNRDAWNTIAPKFWEYEEGKRAELPPAFRDFYESHKATFKAVLDLGCGSGKFLIPMVQDGLNVTGLDISDKMLKEAGKNLEKAKLSGKVKFSEGESTHLDFPDESFDFVFAKGSIHHNMWKDIQQSFKEVARVLRTGQYFLFQGRSAKDSALAIAERVLDVGQTAKDKTGWKQGVIQHYLTKEELEQLARENGFKIVVPPEEILKVKDDSGEVNARWWVVFRKLNN